VDGRVAAAGGGERELRPEEEVGAPPFSLFGKVLALPTISSFGSLRAEYFHWDYRLTIFRSPVFVRRRAEDGEGCRTCSCKKSRCLKL
jgi:hypothetical protein